MTTMSLDFDIVELVPCPAVSAGVPLREMAYGRRTWSPEQDQTLRDHFASDTALSVVAWIVDRTVGSVRDRIRELGLRRRSVVAWNELEDEELALRYGSEPAADIARDFGRLVSAVYTRAKFLGLSEANPPAWTPWEDAQLGAGYPQGIPVPQLAALIGRTTAAVRTRACRLGLTHANQPAGWSDAEMERALELAREGHRYLIIRDLLALEGFPERTKSGFGLRIRQLGYSRGWGRAWSPEEEDLLRKVYRDGTSVAGLARDLDRSRSGVMSKALELGLGGSHPNQGGFRLGPVWNKADSEVLRREFGKTSTKAIAARLGRTVGSVLQRANELGLVHGMHKAWTDEDAHIISVGWRTGVSLTDLAKILDRDPAVIGKYADRLGLRLSDPNRPVKPRRGVRLHRHKPTRAEIVAAIADEDRRYRALPLKPRGRASPAWGKR